MNSWVNEWVTQKSNIRLGRKEKARNGTGWGKMWKQVQIKEWSACLRTSKRWTLSRAQWPEQGGESNVTQTARVRNSQINTGLECANTATQSRGEGPSPDQWPGNKHQNNTCRKTETKQQQGTSVSCMVLPPLCAEPTQKGSCREGAVIQNT
jgi:hypothetical protein